MHRPHSLIKGWTHRYPVGARRAVPALHMQGEYVALAACAQPGPAQRRLRRQTIWGGAARGVERAGRGRWTGGSTGFHAREVRRCHKDPRHPYGGDRHHRLRSPRGGSGQGEPVELVDTIQGTRLRFHLSGPCCAEVWLSRADPTGNMLEVSQQNKHGYCHIKEEVSTIDVYVLSLPIILFSLCS